MAVPAATFLAGPVPWWRAGQPWPALTATVLAVAALVAALAVHLAHRAGPVTGPRRRSPLRPAPRRCARGKLRCNDMQK